MWDYLKFSLTKYQQHLRWDFFLTTFRHSTKKQVWTPKEIKNNNNYSCWYVIACVGLQTPSIHLTAYKGKNSVNKLWEKNRHEKKSQPIIRSAEMLLLWPLKGPTEIEFFIVNCCWTVRSMFNQPQNHVWDFGFGVDDTPPHPPLLNQCTFPDVKSDWEAPHRLQATVNLNFFQSFYENIYLTSCTTNKQLKLS